MKEIITQMITEYLPVILTAVMTAIVGFVKSKYTKIANDSIKKDVAATTVKYIEQIYKDVHGTEKLEKAKETMLALLEEKGIKTAVLSNKPDEFVAKILAKIFPNHKFAFAWGKKPEFDIKPSPDALYAMLKELNIKKEECIYVGDSNVDCYTAQNAGVKCCGVSWGFRGRKELEEAGADVVIDNADEFLEKFSL